MKYAIVLPDGAADEPVERLGGRTPLDVARKPAIDWVARQGRQGLAATVPAGFSPGSDVATLSLFGYDPRIDYTGRAPLEAAARGIAVGPDQLVFRCNFVTITEETMIDFTAGHISQVEADRLIADLNERIGGSACRFHAGVSYRNLLVLSNVGDAAPSCTPPHDIPHQPVADHRPRGPGSEWVIDIMRRAHAILGDHEVNQVRRDLGENPATHIWLWGQGRQRALEKFSDRFGVRGAVIAAVDLICGLAKTVGMTVIDVPGATGYLDTDYTAKGVAAVRALDEFDLAAVHIEAPDEAGHLGDAREKILALERIDQHIVAPLLEKLQTFDRWRILIAPDHPTPVNHRVHTADPPPYCMAGHGVSAEADLPFSEANAVSTNRLISPGHDLMRQFLSSPT